MTENPNISVAIPVYNEEAIVTELLRRTCDVLDNIPGGPTRSYWWTTEVQIAPVNCWRKRLDEIPGLLQSPYPAISVIRLR